MDIGLEAKCDECGSTLEVVCTEHVWHKGKDIIVLQVRPCRICLEEAKEE